MGEVMATSNYTPVLAQLEAQRWQASQAAREQPEIDPRSMLYVLERLIADGQMDEAKRRYAEYKAEAK